MTITANVQRANKDGTKKIHIKKDAHGPDGRPIEAGDTLVLEVVRHKKPDEPTAGN
jgi:hypothetical protein